MLTYLSFYTLENVTINALLLPHEAARGALLILNSSFFAMFDISFANFSHALVLKIELCQVRK